MAFYKMFYILHRRTDWVRLWRWERKVMMPEWYEEELRERQAAMQRLVMPLCVIKSMLHGKTDFI